MKPNRGYYVPWQRPVWLDIDALIDYAIERLERWQELRAARRLEAGWKCASAWRALDVFKR